MGSLLVGNCRCGFVTRFPGGGNRGNFQVYCGAPAYCPQCRTFRVGNYLAPENRCETCQTPLQFYTDPALQERGGQGSRGSVFNWNAKGISLVLPDVNYFCPACQQFRLRFEVEGFFD